MSRCFPFPPPGYEKKLRVEDVTLLAKQKDKDRKEKKHKKDKKKEKKEGREKGKERHKEKDKERHKHKDRDKKNGKKQSRLEKSFVGDRSNVEKVGSSSPQSSCVQELEHRISFVDCATESQTVHNVFDKDQGTSEFLDRVVNRSSGAYWVAGNNGSDQSLNGQRENRRSNFPKVAFVLSNGTEQRTMPMVGLKENDVNKSTEGKDKSAKRHKGQEEIRIPQMCGYDGVRINPPQKAAVVQELERRIRDENCTTGSRICTEANVPFPKTAQNSEKGANGFPVSYSQPKENSEYGNGCYTMENGQEDDNLSRIPKVAISHKLKLKETGCNTVGAVNLGKMAAAEGIERNGCTEKVAMADRMKIQVKDGDRNKLREEKVKEEAGNIAGLSKQYTFRMGSKSAEAIDGKRKEPEANGTLRDNNVQPNKWQKTVLSSQPAAEDGRQSKRGTTITLSTSKLRSANGFDGDEKTSWVVDAKSPHVKTKFPSEDVNMVPSRVDMTKPFVPTEPSNKAHEAVGCQESENPPSNSGNVNGTAEAQGLRQSSSRKEKHRDKSSSKPRHPHPDTKYLSQILLVPKMEELSEFDDPEWLFMSKSFSSKESDVDHQRNEEGQVWAKAVKLESVDVYALPYVIPY